MAKKRRYEVTITFDDPRRRSRTEVWLCENDAAVFQRAHDKLGLDDVDEFKLYHNVPRKICITGSYLDRCKCCGHEEEFTVEVYALAQDEDPEDTELVWANWSSW